MKMKGMGIECGDIVKLEVEVVDNKIVSISYESQASKITNKFCEYFKEKMLNKTIEEVKSFDWQSVLKENNIKMPSKRKKALLFKEALFDALGLE